MNNRRFLLSSLLGIALLAAGFAIGWRLQDQPLVAEGFTDGIAVAEIALEAVALTPAPPQAEERKAPKAPVDAAKAPVNASEMPEGYAPLRIQSAEDVKGVDDPETLLLAGSYYLEKGDEALARTCYEGAIDKAELTRYLKYRPSVRDALVLERMGKLDDSAARWRKSFDDDVLYAAYVLRAVSVHPSRDALFDEAMAGVRAKAEEAAAGGEPTIYVTSKGEPRALTLVTQEDALKLAMKGEAVKYAYIPDLDLSEAAVPVLPPLINLERVVVGRIRMPNRAMGRLIVKGIVLGDLSLGKTWEGPVNASKVIPPSTFEMVDLRNAIVLGAANFQGIQVTGSKAYFPLTVFEKGADFRGLRVQGVAEFRYAVFGDNVNFKGSRFLGPTYMVETRFRKETIFTGLYAEQRLYFPGARFEAATTFDGCEWLRGATFENARFYGPSTFTGVRSGGRFNFSRSVFHRGLSMDRVETDELDFLGAWLRGDASFRNCRFQGDVRFAPTIATMEQYAEDPQPIYQMYRDYQGDEDADEPLSTQSAYGVERIQDLVSRVDSSISFSNSVFEGFALFTQVVFGAPGSDAVAEFYNTQFAGETHFEEAVFHAAANLASVFAYDISLNDARINKTLILDDANIPGRITLTDVVFSPQATLSLYGVQLNSMEIDISQVVAPNGTHRLAYHRCAMGEELDPLRTKMALDGRAKARDVCTDRVVNEYVTLKGIFADNELPSEEDYCYWWIKHHKMRAAWYSGKPGPSLGAAIQWLIFENGFGWGVRLQNIGYTAIVMVFIFAGIYRRFCPDTIMSYNGNDMAVRDVPWAGIVFISAQSLIAINTGWDFGQSNHRFRYINTLNTLIGFVLLTFFVGAYTRMVLA